MGLTRLSSALRRRAFSTSAPPPVGIVMLNMGGPSSLSGAADGVQPFLTRLFLDPEIIGLPRALQPWLGTTIAARRAPRIEEQYRAIGGKSPIGDWTRKQGDAMVAKLHAMTGGAAAAGAGGSGGVSSASAAAAAAAAPPRFKHYTCFRYAPPLTAQCLEEMRADGVTRAVAFSQYPHFSCTTTGSSLNHLWRESLRLGLDASVEWSLIDRWPTHAGFVAAVARNVAAGLARFPAAVRDEVCVVFSAHSLPMLTVNKGDQYVQEVGATVSAVMDLLRAGRATLPPPVEGAGEGAGAAAGAAAGASAGAGAPVPVPPVRSPYVLAWQSKVGFLPWMGPPSSDVLKGLGRQGHRYVLMVPIAFTSDHVETLFEIDIEYRQEAHHAGFLQFERAPSLNDSDLLTTAQAHLVAEHLGLLPAAVSVGAGVGAGAGAGAAAAPTLPPSPTAFPAVASPQYSLNCAGCVNPTCRSVLRPARPFAKLRDAYDGGASGGCKAVPGSPWPSAEEAARLRALTAPSV
jgi:ferrochelatase